MKLTRSTGSGGSIPKVPSLLHWSAEEDANLSSGWLQEGDCDYPWDDSGGPKLADSATPPRYDKLLQGIPDEHFMLKGPDCVNSKMAEDVQLLETRAKEEIKEMRLEFEREKVANRIQQKELDDKCKILTNLLAEESLSPPEEDLKSKLIEELVYN